VFDFNCAAQIHPQMYDGAAFFLKNIIATVPDDTVAIHSDPNSGL
jgi:hypothetical protein